MSIKEIFEQIQRNKNKPVLEYAKQVGVNNNFYVKDSKRSGVQIFHKSGKTLFRENENKFKIGFQELDYTFYENGLLILNHQYDSYYDYYGTQIDFYNNNGDLILNECFIDIEYEKNRYLITVYKDKIHYYLPGYKNVYIDLNSGIELDNEIEL